MNILFVLVFSLMSFGTPAASVNDCSGPSVPVCENIMYVGQTPEGSPSAILVQRANLGPNTQIIVTDVGLDAFISGMNSEQTIFEPEGDATKSSADSFDFLNDDQSVRVIVGTSDLVERNQDAVLVVVYDAKTNEAFIFFNIGVSETLPSDIENIVESNDITIAPKGYEAFDANDELSL